MTAKFKNGALCDPKERKARIARIVCSYRKGEKVHWIAAQEDVTAKYVCDVAQRHGMRRWKLRRDAHPTP